MFSSVPNLELGNAEDALLAFFQSQRSGSHAVNRWLHTVFDPEQVYFYRNVEDFVHWRDQKPEILSGYRIYSGFSDFTPLDLDRNVVAFASVRHPLHRLMSLYGMSKREDPHVYHQLATDNDFEDYYRKGSEDRPYYFRNLCTQRVSGTDSFDAAQEMIERYFGAVATTDELPAFTQLIAESYGWEADPVATMPPDEERYAEVMRSPLAERILEENSADLALYEFVKNFDHGTAVESIDRPPVVETSAAKPAAEEPQRQPEGGPKHGACPICGDPMTVLKKDDYCPNCNMPARGRSMVPLLDEIVGPWVNAEGRTDLPILAFAATSAEKDVLSQTWPAIKSVSLYGSYGKDHEEGVDVRNMAQYADNSFSAAMGILLFDYFPEQEEALRELYRVLAPGSAMFTLILSGRVLPGDVPPEITKRIQPKPGYFDYIPEGGELLSVKVGQDWMLNAMARAGFVPQQIRLFDEPTGQTLEWFVGYKPKSGVRPPLPLRDGQAAQSSAPKPEEAVATEAPAVISRQEEYGPDGKATVIPSSTRDGEEWIEGLRREYRRDVDPSFGFKTVRLSLTIPSVPKAGRIASFAEHQTGTGNVHAVMPGGVLTSDDLGETWRAVSFPEVADVEFESCFTTGSGVHLVQTKTEDPFDGNPGKPSFIHRFAPDWGYLGAVPIGNHRWHGTSSIGQHGDTIIWAEYPDNRGNYTKGKEDQAISPRVFRSRDDGATWETVFTQSGDAIRHFHTVLADPHVPGQWWLSSGDRPNESRVWLSRDDGDSWIDITNVRPDVELNPSAQPNAQAVQRYTDIWLGKDRLIWGSDDWLGSPRDVQPPDSMNGGNERRSGSRMFISDRVVPLQPRNLGWVGNPVRSLIDVGPALIATTEAKYDKLTRPQVCLVAKDGQELVEELITIDVAGNATSGLTFSRASRAAENGRFFSFRSSRDLGQYATRILEWHVEFD